MNPNTGRFSELAPGEAAPAGWPILRVGESVEIKGFTFVVIRINRTTIVLKPAIALEPDSVQMARLVDLPPVKSSRGRRRRVGKKRHHCV
jgi:hypothetical protein